MSKKLSSYIGDRFMPKRNADLWDIQFNKDNKTYTPALDFDITSRTNLATIDDQMNMNQTNAELDDEPQAQNRPANENLNIGRNRITPGLTKSILYMRVSKINKYRGLLRNELLGDSVDELEYFIKQNENKKCFSALKPREINNLFQYNSNKSTKARDEASKQNNQTRYSPYSKYHLSSSSEKLLNEIPRPKRVISNAPIVSLDAPKIFNDFYLNLLDWSNRNMVAVGLESALYVWSPITRNVTNLYDYAIRNDFICSVSWCEDYNLLAVGTAKGDVYLWDVVAQKILRTMRGHGFRVGSLAWNGNLVCSGSRDRTIFIRDIRAPYHEPGKKLQMHEGEVCGLKWSPDKSTLASGGNDNTLIIWDANKSMKPIYKFTEHKAAIKAIAWSPHKKGLVASGGGQSCKYIHFWDALTGEKVQSVDTGSQVSNLAWLKHTNELISTHGTPNNQVHMWQWPSLEKSETITGHSQRILYLAVSPSEEVIVTGSSDESLRFWNIYNKPKSFYECESPLGMLGKIR